MLSASLVLFALKPAPAPVIGVMRPAVPAAVTVSQTSAVPEAAVSEADVHRRIQAAVDEAVELKTKDLMKEIQSERVRLMLATDQLEQDERRMQRMQVMAANYVLPERYREEAK
jgi:hypothetical protein